jgi:rhamnulokinase
MPDVFNYWLTGQASSEPTIASTSQFFNPQTRNWSRRLLRKLDISDDILPELKETGAVLGGTKDGIEIQTTVFATAGHDTASAVAAVPADGDEGWCYISSGTWSLMGVELAEPILTREAMHENFTNEAGAAGRIRFLKNIAGLWILQECRRQWTAERLDLSYEAVTHLAAAAPPLRSVIDVDQFLAPGYMTERIRNFCLQTGQEAPNSPGEIARTVLESLAVRYRLVKESLERLTGETITRIHIVGGGARNELLNQLTADACNATVIAGPVEATAAGNILIQSNGGDLAAIRTIVRNSFRLKTYQPRSPGDWDELVTRARKFTTPAV